LIPADSVWISVSAPPYLLLNGLSVKRFVLRGRREKIVSEKYIAGTFEKDASRQIYLVGEVDQK